MRKAYRYLIPAILAIVMLAGCGNADDELGATGHKDRPNFTATIGGTQTRAFDTSWEPEDKIGISGGGSTNVCYITNNGDGSFVANTPGEEFYFKDDSEVEFTAYYPWKEEGGTTTINGIDMLKKKQKELDFLWAKAKGRKGAPNVDFRFTHRMAKVSFTIKPGTDMTYDELKNAEFKLTGRFRNMGTFNTADGIAAATGNVSSKTQTCTGGRLNDTGETVTCSFIFFPQVLLTPSVAPSSSTSSTWFTFSATIQLAANISITPQVQFNFSSVNNEWVAGRQYDLSLTLNKTHAILDGCTIKSWTDKPGADITVE